MKKHVMGLCAALLLVSGFTSVPTISAASLTVKSNVKSKLSNKTTDEATLNNDDSSNTLDGSSNEGTNSDDSVDSVEKVIADGMKYKGTPYEFGSNRSTATTFDCSDFVRWIFKESLDINLPSDSRQQGAYVKDNGTAENDWHNLKRGDLMFFMTYKGSNSANYKAIDKASEKITHVGIYLGNGKILHTYSNDSGGVHEGDFAGTTWEQRFLFGGSVLPVS
ncbi:C40 family peptidase [Cohnella abietis]|uniref:NlpC/P60 domain-containing protein n=1 Tax=Cohnella abietis TaxID=2507935 RepID=A0A3T1DAX0_9BACL|nr:C40 family peptidase [Cohnella abietis]BBI35184.1 hypothetical protein KCTCHS21_45830 [Cohnella abietis]